MQALVVAEAGARAVLAFRENIEALRLAASRIQPPKGKH